MIITFGKYLGTTYEKLLFEHPEYVLWMLNVENPAGLLVEAVQRVQKLIDKLDSIPVNRDCNDTGCLEKATRCCLSQSSPEPTWFCDKCLPSVPEGSPASPTFVHSYFDFVKQAARLKKDDAEAAEEFLRQYAAAKGIFQAPSTYKLEREWPISQAPNAGNKQICGWGSCQLQKRFTGSRWPGKEQPVETKTTPIVN